MAAMPASGTTPSIEPRRGVRGAALAILLYSVLAVVPCLWQPHITNGDLGSHIYNAWLARGIERGEYPQLYLAPVHTNVLFDRLASWLLGWLPPSTAERAAVSATMLIFFWGAFAAAGAIAGRLPWAVTPLLLLLAHGWALQLGLMNFYLGSGIALVAFAVLWRLSLLRVLLGCSLLVLAGLAQPLPALWVAAAIAYKAVFEHATRLRAWMLLAGIALVALTGVALRVRYPSVWSFGQWRQLTGADHAVAYGPEYKLVEVAICAAAAWVLFDRWRAEPLFWLRSLTAHFWILLSAGVMLLPSGIHFRAYVWPYGFVTQRLSCLLAVVGIAGLAAARPRRGVVVSFAVIAAVFFSMLYHDTRRLNRIQKQFDEIVRRYPHGQRFFTVLTDWHGGNHAPYFNHMLGRACIGRCFDYGSFEVATRQFRIRARGPNPFVQIDFNPNIAEKFRTTNPGMTLYNIDWCRPASDELCVKEIALQQASAGRP